VTFGSGGLHATTKELLYKLKRHGSRKGAGRFVARRYLRRRHFNQHGYGDSAWKRPVAFHQFSHAA
jgi:hypothetical protein